MKGLRPERTSAGGGDCLPKPNSSSKVQFVEYVAEWEYLWGSAARGRDWLGLHNSAENQCDRRLWELIGWLFIEVFYNANMEAVEDLARSAVLKSVGLQMGEVPNQDTWGRAKILGFSVWTEVNARQPISRRRDKKGRRSNYNSNGIWKEHVVRLVRYAEVE